MANNIRGRQTAAIIAETICWVLLAAAVWLYTYQFDRDVRSYAFGTVSWPRAIILLIVVAALVSCFYELRSRPLTMTAAETTGVNGIANAAGLKIAATFLLPLLYVWLLPYAGYFATTPFFVAGYAFLFGQRSVYRICLATCIIWITTIVIFTRFLYVPLPVGNWPLFYQVSNWIVSFLQ